MLEKFIENGSDIVPGNMPLLCVMIPRRTMVSQAKKTYIVRHGSQLHLPLTHGKWKMKPILPRQHKYCHDNTSKFVLER